MKKMVLVLLLGLTVILLITSHVLSEKINEGHIALAEGRKQIARGEVMLAHGKYRLMNGEHELAAAKKTNEIYQDIPLMSLAEKVPVGGEILNMPNKKIAEGDKEVSMGKIKLKNGEEKLALGKLQLQAGIDQLNQAMTIQKICRIVGLICGVLFLLLWWRFKRPTNR